MSADEGELRDAIRDIMARTIAKGDQAQAMTDAELGERLLAGPRNDNRRLANRVLLESLASLWDAFPDYRFGQLVMNLSRVDGGFADTWEWDHATWQERIDKYTRDWAS